jgi:hypothetical protein
MQVHEAKYVATDLIFNLGDRQYVGNPLHIGVKQLHFFGHFGRLQGQKKCKFERNKDNTFNSLSNGIARILRLAYYKSPDLLVSKSTYVGII